MATTTSETITTEQIQALRSEAGQHGDLAQVAICDTALTGDVTAIAICASVIMAAEAMRDDAELTL